MSGTQKYFASHASEETLEQDSLHKTARPDFHPSRQTSSTAGNPVQENFKRTTDGSMQISEDIQLSKNSQNNIEDSSWVQSQAAKADPRKKSKRPAAEMGYKTSNKKLVVLQLHEAGGKNQSAFKSAIAPLAGTVKGLNMIRRPEPPPKRSSLKPIDTSKYSTLKQSTLITEKTSNTSNGKVDSKISEKNKIIPAETTEQSKKKKNLNKSPPQTSDDAIAHFDKEVDTHSIHFQGMKSASELLEEAKYLAMSDAPKIYERNFEISKPEQSLTAAQQTFTAKAKSVDEIIVSLRSVSQTTSQSASNMKIKGLLDRVLGYSFSSISEMDDESIESVTKISHEVRLEEETTKDLDGTLISTVTSPVSKGEAAAISEQAKTSLKQNASEIIKSLPDTLTNEEALEIIGLPSEVTYSDVINVKGSTFGSLKKIAGDREMLLEKDETFQQQTSVLATWTPKDKDHGYQTIHHLCVTKPSHVLPIDLQLASRLYFTPSRLGHGSSKLPDFVQHTPSFICSKDDFSSLKQQKKARHIYEGIPVSEAIQENLQDSVTVLPPLSPEYLSEWQKVAEYYVERPRLILLGKSMQIHKDATKLFWTPALPKFAVPISHIQETLYPKLQMELDQVNPCDFHLNQDEEYDVNEEQDNLNKKAALQRTLLKKHKSLSDLQGFSDQNSKHMTDKEHMLQIYASSPNLNFSDDEKTLRILSSFQSTIKENEHQRDRLILASLEPAQEHILSKEKSENQMIQDTEDSQQSLNMDFPKVETKIGKSETQQKKVKAYMKKPLLPRKLAYISQKFSKHPNILTRSASLPTCVRLHVISERSSPPIKLKRRCSLPSFINFETFVKTQGGITTGVADREWVRNIWNNWFDEVFPPLKSFREAATYQRGSSLHDEINKSQQAMKREIRLQNLSLEMHLLYSSVSESENAPDALLSEVNKLTHLINVQGKKSAFNYGRRGALRRKLAQLQLAMADLNQAIKLEPMLLNAYWHRHLIYLLQMKTSEALDDLNYILKHNKNHADAYTSKGDIYRDKGDITMAIINYSQGLKCRPDADIYFRRAQLYEASNDMLMAMEDYRLAFTLNPKRTDALMKHGLYYFDTSNWPIAIKDFTAVIKDEPNNAQARDYRGQAYAKQGLFREAIVDLSVAIHLEPNNWMDFYHRACLLRKVHPFKALQDFSVSVLINNEVENLNSFLHRGILYTELNQWPAAIWDFEWVIKLDRAVSLAHINLGLIFLLKMDHYYEAIHRFTDALKVEPTSTKAYVCRAEAYRKVHNLGKALKDITCAIHLQPQAQNLYLTRGQYLLQMKKLDLASFYIQYAAEINQGTARDSSPTQQATVQSFLKNYDRVIDNLKELEKSPSVLTLLGETQVKAGRHQEALNSYQEALDMAIERSELEFTSDPSEFAGLYYLMGCCNVKLNKLIEAIDSFNKALKMHSNFANAYYQRGLCRMKLREINSIYDFHRALAIDPQLFEVYLSRAVYYANQQRYLKAILSCNEALKLQPQSARAFLCRGALKYHAKLYHLAIDDTTAAINIDEACILGYFNRAVSYQQANDLQKALKDYGIIQLLGCKNKLNLKALINRGLLYLSMEDHFNASQDFKAAIVEDPKNPSIYHAMAISYHKLHYLEEAVKGFTQAVKLDPFFADAYNGRGNVYMDSGHPAGIKQAQKDFVRALHLNPRCVKARINLGYNLQVLGAFQKAWYQFTITADIDPNFEDAYEGRAIVSLQMNNTLGALHDMNAALGIAKSAKLFTNRGVINQFMGDLPDAMRDYTRAIALDPTYSLAYLNKANLYLCNSQFQQAHDQYTKAIDLQPRDESALLNRAICRVMLKLVKEALEDFEEAIKLSPYSAHIYFNRANLFATLKQYQDADKDYSQALLLMPDDALFYKLRADVRGHLGLTDQAITDYKIAISIQEDK
ncbi:uncharacterized protein ttc6 isoform X4 [Leucoraja erinacea]|uniref:uncharacterized protein ttc6 isoform X4 n=1 Tax=Leucoraja erinaceus TaxID=7782 RepID=UPI002455B212|nr:uncharacterized protein ttc6 isoform X4 [Leucoraja erinacea]